MYRNFVHFQRGNVRLKIESPTPERVLNLCAAHSLSFWDVHYVGQTALFLQMARRDVTHLRMAVRNIQAEITVLGETGAPLLVQTFRRRYVLWGALAAFALLAWCGHTFIWSFEVSGNTTVPTQTILHALEDYGITVGTRSQGIDQKDMRNHVLLALPDVNWLAVNVKGCTAHVQVVERVRPPQRIRDEDKMDVVAAKAGLVTRVLALDGEKCVLPGTTVTEGQLLISGAVDRSDRGGTRFLHAHGQVWARTWYDLTVKVPLTIEERGKVRRVSRGFGVNFGKHHMKIAAGGSILGTGCDKIAKESTLTLPGGFCLPITFCREKTVIYETQERQRSPEEAAAQGQRILRELLQEQLSDEAQVENVQFSQSTEGDCLLVTLSAECLEQIGVEVPIT